MQEEKKGELTYILYVRGGDGVLVVVAYLLLDFQLETKQPKKVAAAAAYSFYGKRIIFLL